MTNLNTIILANDIKRTREVEDEQHKECISAALLRCEWTPNEQW